MHMDGVNGITQCPIMPQDYFTYSWKATQYGSTWYHSHYTVQYADGMQGPIVSYITSSVHIPATWLASLSQLHCILGLRQSKVSVTY